MFVVLRVCMREFACVLDFACVINSLRVCVCVCVVA